MVYLCGGYYLALKRKVVLTPTIARQDTVPSERSQEKDTYCKIHLDEIPTVAKFMETGCRKREPRPGEGGESVFNGNHQASFLLEKVLVENGRAGYSARELS